jgi:hypothetical protein
MNQLDARFRTFLKRVWYLKRALSVLGIAGLLTSVYYFNDIRVASQANKIARLSSSPEVVAIASNVYYGVGINKEFLQQIFARRIVIRLANVGQVPTSLTKIGFEGYVKASWGYQLRRQNIDFSYGESVWEPFHGHAAFVWPESPPALLSVIGTSLESPPWDVEEGSKERVRTYFNSDLARANILSGDELDKGSDEQSDPLSRDYSIPGAGLPIVIPANVTTDITIDILVRGRGVVRDTLSSGTRQFSGVDRALIGSLTLDFPGSDSVQLQINEVKDRGSLDFHYAILNDEPLLAVGEFGLVEESTTISYRKIPQR